MTVVCMTVAPTLIEALFVFVVMASHRSILSNHVTDEKAIISDDAVCLTRPEIGFYRRATALTKAKRQRKRIFHSSLSFCNEQKLHSTKWSSEQELQYVDDMNVISAR